MSVLKTIHLDRNTEEVSMTLNTNNHREPVNNLRSIRQDVVMSTLKIIGGMQFSEWTTFPTKTNSFWSVQYTEQSSLTQGYLWDPVLPNLHKCQTKWDEQYKVSTVLFSIFCEPVLSDCHIQSKNHIEEALHKEGAIQFIRNNLI